MGGTLSKAISKNAPLSVVREEKEAKYYENAVHRGFLIIDNFTICEGKNLKEYFRSEFMSIFIVTKGTAKISLNMQDINVKENSMIHVAPNTLIGSAACNQSCLVSGIRFSTDFISDIGMPERVADIFSYFSSKFHPVWELEPEDTSIVREQINALIECSKNYATHPFGKEILIHTFYIFLFKVGALGQKYSQMTRLNFSRQESLVIKFSNLAQQQFREERTVKKYADQLNVSAKYLTEVVKEYSGKNASEIINDLVILEAKFLLSKSQLSIGQVAETLHFSDQSFFGKYFKRQTGISPKTYRESEF